MPHDSADRAGREAATDWVCCEQSNGVPVRVLGNINANRITLWKIGTSFNSIMWVRWSSGRQ